VTLHKPRPPCERLQHAKLQQQSLGGLALRGARRSRTGASNRWYLSEARALLDSSGRRLVASDETSVMFDSCDEV